MTSSYEFYPQQAQDQLPIRHNSNLKLSDYLEKQKNLSNLSLGDLLFGNEGLQQVTNFIKQFNKFTTINIRGNDISGPGFAELCEALIYCPSLTKISAEWNNIGSDSAGLLALQKLLKANTRISWIDLRNNQIGTKCVGILSKLISQAKAPLYIDLRWNQISDDGARDLLIALESTSYNIRVDLNGNQVSEEDFVKLHKFSSSYHTSTSQQGEISKPSSKPLSQTGSIYNSLLNIPSNSDSQAKIKLNYNYDQIKEQRDRMLKVNKENAKENDLEHNANLKVVIRNLEETLYQERQNLDMAHTEVERLLAEAQIRDRERHAFQLQYNELAESFQKRTLELQQAHSDFEHVVKQNDLLKKELKKYEQENVRVNQVFNTRLIEIDDRHKRELKDLVFDKESYQFQIEKLKAQFADQMEDVLDKCDKKYKYYEEEIHKISTLNAELSATVTKQALQIQNIKTDANDQIRQAVDNIRIEEGKKNQMYKKNLEVEFHLLQGSNKDIHNKYIALVHELEIQKQINQDLQTGSLEESKHLQIKIENLVKQSGELSAKIIQLNGELASKDNFIFKLEEEIVILNKEIQERDRIAAEKIERVQRDFEFDKKRLLQNENSLNYNIAKLENELRESKAEIKRLKTEYERVADTLRGNVNKIIIDTFLENAGSDLR